MSNITPIFENDDIVVINKPVGVMVHADGHNTLPTVADWFLEHYPESKGVGEKQTLQDGTVVERSGIVHRLDSDTSGVMVLARRQPAYESLKAEFHDRRVHKEYRAFIYGWMNDKWGTIDRPIGRSAKDPRRRSAQRGAKGVLREASTDWELIGQGEYGPQDERFAYLKLLPKTGRTHQLRAHLRAIDRPIVGDTLYAPEALRDGTNLEIDRLALHAHILEINVPELGVERFVAPVPQLFEDAAERIAQ